MRVKEIIAARLKLSRERLGLSQQELAAKMDWANHQTVSDIENGKRELKAWELAALASLLHIDLDDFFRPSAVETAAPILWRDQSQTPSREEEVVFLLRCNQYHQLEQACELDKPEELPGAAGDPVTFGRDRAAALAQECQLRFGLGSQPADSLVSVLENRFRVKIWYMPLTGKGSAACTCGDFGCGILMNSDEPPWRRNFNFAHELFHLVTWQCFAPAILQSEIDMKEKAEKLANAFAAQLLLPADALRVDFNAVVDNDKVSYLSLIHLARKYGVSTEALLYRLDNLRLIRSNEVNKALEDPYFRRLDRSSMPAHWSTPPPIPPRFVELAFVAYRRGRLSQTRLAEMLDTSLVGVEAKLREYGLSEEETYETEIPVASDPAENDGSEVSEPPA